MANIIFRHEFEAENLLEQMQLDARFDVMDNDEALIPDLSFIKQNIKSKKSAPKVPKLFLSNDCIFNCAYCGCRSGADCQKRYRISPQKLAELSIQQARESGRGIFITSAIYKNADYTEELIIETMKILRCHMGYQGYIHAKIMPGTDPALIHEAGRYANRLSVNIEVAKSEGYRQIAKNKNKSNILLPMAQISNQIQAAALQRSRFSPPFATSQTTQLMVGSTQEDDYTILNLSGALYQKFALSRVYYTPFCLEHQAAGYDALPSVHTPNWRVRRLYQADRLMQLYGFTAQEIAPENSRYLPEDIDPKAAWALRNLHLFPIEVNTADRQTLLRIPGIGTVYADRILAARKYTSITHDTLREIGVSLKRCQPFITCNGKFKGAATGDKPSTLRRLLSDQSARRPAQLTEAWQFGSDF